MHRADDRRHAPQGGQGEASVAVVIEQTRFKDVSERLEIAVRCDEGDVLDAEEADECETVFEYDGIGRADAAEHEGERLLPLLDVHLVADDVSDGVGDPSLQVRVADVSVRLEEMPSELAPHVLAHAAVRVLVAHISPQQNHCQLACAVLPLAAHDQQQRRRHHALRELQLTEVSLRCLPHRVVCARQRAQQLHHRRALHTVVSAAVYDSSTDSRAAACFVLNISPT